MGGVDDLAEDFGMENIKVGERRGSFRFGLYDTDKAQRAVEMLLAGHKYRHIAKVLRVTIGAVSRWRASALAQGVAIPERKGGAKPGMKPGSLVACGHCGRLGHNRRTCLEPRSR
jgi:hypothetical protein